jgi:hypothetical protein
LQDGFCPDIREGVVLYVGIGFDAEPFERCEMSPLLCRRCLLSGSLRRIARLGTALFFFAIAGCISKAPEIEPIPDPLVAPMPRAPADGRQLRYSTTGAPPTVELVWRHGMPTAQVPIPYQADRMIICIYDEQRGRCESGSREGVPQPIWLEVAADDPKINRTPIRQERHPFISSPEIDLGYEFRTSLQMRPEYRNRNLLWQVGACLGGTCRMSDPRSLRISSGTTRHSGL